MNAEDEVHEPGAEPSLPSSDSLAPPTTRPLAAASAEAAASSTDDDVSQATAMHRADTPPEAVRGSPTVSGCHAFPSFTNPLLPSSPQDDDEYMSQDEDDCPSPNGDEGAAPAGGEAAAAAAHLAAGRFDKAILSYSNALKGCDDSGERAALLTARADAYCSLSRHLRSIPAAQSERQAVYAPDPHSLAGSALRDADSALRVVAGPAAAAHARRGDALFLLERYSEALESYRLASAQAPSFACIAAKMEACEAALADDGGSPPELPTGTGSAPCAGPLAAVRAQALQDAECTLCMKLLYEPVTTPCGHTFCRPCLSRSYDHSNKCPMCRTVLHAVGQIPVSIVLKNILERSFPDDYLARAEEEEEEVGAGAAHESPTLPLFVMSPVLPGERMALNIFEPRYRLMVRRVMAGARRFGMATVAGDHSLHPVACEVEVTECEPLPDGRFYIEVVGRRRFRPGAPAEQDGYRVARPEFVQDAAPVAGSAEVGELERVAVEVEGMADAWMGRVRALGQSRRAAAELLRRVEPKPADAAADRERFSFWVANLVCPVLDDAAVKLRMLSMMSTLERLKLCRSVLMQLQDASMGGCVVM
jgi:Lon protease-like protein/tetratricopeptide (TPR) repeat protein